MAQLTSTEDRLTSVEDRLAIQELNQRYATHIDLREVDDWVALFTPDALFDEREFDGPLCNGHGDIRTYGLSLVETVESNLHHVTTHVISNLTALSATGVSFTVCEFLMKDGSRGRAQVIYRDRYEKVGGRWLIAERILRKSLPPEVL